MRTEKYGLKVDDKLVEFVEANALPGIDISSDNFWKGLASIVNNLGPKNRELLQKRKELKQKIDSWHIENRGKQFDAANYKEFLKSIGYLVDEGADFEIETSNVDDEIANIAGPQLVVPITNYRLLFLIFFSFLLFSYLRFLNYSIVFFLVSSYFGFSNFLASFSFISDRFGLFLIF
jgi:malate synthase